jgi:hypothetical protein
MKKLIFLATLFLLTSCDALTGNKPKSSVSPTPVTSETASPTNASGVIGTETPGPTSSSSPVPSLVSGNSASATPGNVTTTIANGLPSNLNNQPNNPLNQPPLSAAVKESTTDAGKALDNKKEPSNSSPASSPSIKNPELSLAFGDSQNGGISAKENGKGTKKGVNAAVDSSSTLASQNASPVKSSTLPQAITDGGIGAVKVGMTLAEVKKNLKPSTRFETQINFLPGYNALAVKQQGKVQFYIPYLKSKKVADTDQVKFLVTDNPLYKTAEGVSPGMTIKKAAAIYGNAQLAFDPKDKIGESVTFANQPGDLYFFTSNADRNAKAGVYSKKVSQQGFVTDKFIDSGRIKRITVICSEIICPSNQP